MAVREAKENEMVRFRFSYDPVTDEMHLRCSEGAPVRTFPVSDDLWVSFDEASSIVEVLAEAATLGRSQEWRSMLCAVAGKAVLKQLDRCEDIGEPLRDQEVEVSRRDSKALRMNWTAFVAWDLAGADPAASWEDFRDSPASVPIGATAEDRPTARQKIGAVIDRIAAAWGVAVDAIVAQSVTPALVGGVRVLSSDDSSPREDSEFEIAIDESVAEPAGIGRRAVGRIDGVLLGVALQRLDLEKPVPHLALVVLGPDGHVVGDEAYFTVDADYPGAVEAQIELPADVASSISSAVNSGRVIDDEGYAFEIVGLEAPY